ncbi:MAG: imidazoleglycerol-phosphate dehydratase HisB [Oscillospiraceae bacterium]
MQPVCVTRTTRETAVTVRLARGAGPVEIDTGIGFFDHMLTALAVHSGFSLAISAKGDLNVDGHHTVEDVGIVLGDAFAQLLGDRSGIARYGTATIPMDEALGFCSLDISGRPFLVFDAPMPQERIGEYDACLTKEFFRAFAFHAGITLHLKGVYGENSHHITEALFKAAAHALRQGTEPTRAGALSTKGVL